MKAMLQTVRFCNEDVIATSYCSYVGQFHFAPKSVTTITDINGNVMYQGEFYTYTYEDGGLRLVQGAYMVPFLTDQEIKIGEFYHAVGKENNYVYCQIQNHVIQ